MLKWIIGLVLTGALAGLIYVYVSCPCERIPGMKLSGVEHTEPVEDWTFANSAALCQLEVSGVIPHSINLNCMSDGPNLFLSCSRCDGKYWSGIALAEPRGRIRIDDVVYPVELTRVTDDAELNHAWAVRARKLSNFGRGSDAPRPDHWWSFRLTPRAG